jgi:isorenieratene synthase
VADEIEINEEVIVIGAGVAGLTAAVHLAERGVPVRVLEADQLYAGGRLWGGPPTLHASPFGTASLVRAGSFTSNTEIQITLNGHTQSFYSEHGIHGLWWNYANIRALCERFGLQPNIVPAREQAWIHAEGHRVQWSEVGAIISRATLPSPLNYLELFGSHRFLAMLGVRDWLALPAVWWSLLLCLALDPFESLLTLEGQTLEDFFRGWSPKLRAMFIGLARSGLASTPEKISLAAFIAAMRFYTVQRRDSLRFAYFTSDPGTEFINPLIERLQAKGGELLLGHTALQVTGDEVSGVNLGGGHSTPDTRYFSKDTRHRWKIVVETPRGLRTLYAAHIILATDAPAARRLLLESPFTAPAAQNLVWPEGLLNATVRVWLNRLPRDGPEGGIFTGDFTVDNFFWLNQIQAEYAEWARRTGGSVVEMHLYRPDEFFNQPDAAIVARAVDDLYRAYPELRGALIQAVLQRNAATHTRLMIDKAERWLGTATPWPNLWACGDWVRGPWPALFLERACVSGVEVANHVLAALNQKPFLLADYDPPEWLAARIRQWLLGGRAWVRQNVAHHPNR